ncbi:MAG TPA: YceI family protein [Chitinophagaceae bacterium]|nr:YceI family protein [Chitinophagaceae bacterium]
MAKTKWVLDELHSELGFKIRHLMISNVSGTFRKFTVSAETDQEDFSTAKINLTAEMASVNTNNDQRDEHLRNSDFFEVENYPQLSFESTDVEKTDDNSFTLFGNLTMKGVTKPVKLEVEHSGVIKDNWGGERAGFTVTGKIRRTDWGVNFNAITEAGGFALGEDVKIHGEIQLIKQAVAVPA